MNKKFANPYVIFYPTVSRDGMPFPINKCLKEIQGRSFREAAAWRGNIIIAKYRESPFSSMINGSIADFPILRNYFMTHGAPQVSNPVVLCRRHTNHYRVSLKKRTSSCMQIPTSVKRTINFMKPYVDMPHGTLSYIHAIDNRHQQVCL
jgi:hypothetical protein